MKQKLKSLLFYGGISFFFALLGLILGFLLGATFGGNFVCGHYYYALCEYSSFAGVRGYETTGIFGGMLGVFLGSCLSITVLTKLKKEKIRYGSIWLASFCSALLGLVFLQLLFILNITDSVLGLLAFFFPFATAIFVFFKITK
jgi:hypothetical protein